jgi:hypothetical protein
MRQDKWLDAGENERRDGDQREARELVYPNGHPQSGGQQRQTGQPKGLPVHEYELEHRLEISPDAPELIA